MANTYEIIIENKSKKNHSYALIAEVPIVEKDKPKGSIWQNAMAIADSAKGDKSRFKIERQFYAVAGSYSSIPAVGVTVETSQPRKVTLGADKSKGTSLSYTVEGGKYPQFKEAENENAPDKSFEITTDETFDYEHATQKNWFVGLGGSQNGTTSAIATWIPEPKVTYQIKPAVVFYITYGDYSANNIVDVKTIGSRAKLDFSILSNPVTIIHQPNGNLEIQDPKEHDGEE